MKMRELQIWIVILRFQKRQTKFNSFNKNKLTI